MPYNGRPKCAPCGFDCGYMISQTVAKAASSGMVISRHGREPLFGNLCPGRIAVGPAAKSVGRIGCFAQWRKLGRRVAVKTGIPGGMAPLDPSIAEEQFGRRPAVAARLGDMAARHLGGDSAHIMRAATGNTLQLVTHRLFQRERKGKRRMRCCRFHGLASGPLKLRISQASPHWNDIRDSPCPAPHHQASASAR